MPIFKNDKNPHFFTPFGPTMGYFKMPSEMVEFLNKNMVSFDILDKVLINLGPGKYSSIRTSISTLKALNLIYKFKIYGFSSKDVEKSDYSRVLNLLKKGKLIKNLIKPLYMS